MLESFECNKPAHADDAWRCVGLRWQQVWKRLQIDPIINPVNFRGGIRTPLAKQLATVIGFGRNKLRVGADFAQEIIIAKVLHEILSVCRNAERNSGNFFHEKRGMRCAIGKVDMKTIDAVAREKIREIERVACALFSLNAWTVFAFVSINELTWPFSSGFRFLFPDPQDFLRWRVVN